MDRHETLVVRMSDDVARVALSDLVIAWARDVDTGEPRYILELGVDRRGAKCRCECASCGLPLTAVNAAKAEFVRRPHFRHPDGAEKSDCAVLTARSAVLRQLTVDGWLELPRRRMSGRSTGLSGELYEVWVDSPPEKVHITKIIFCDRASAILTLDDGRKLHVLLTGSAGDASALLSEDGIPPPTILLDVNDPAIAAMSPEELRQRLTLLPDSICWQGHWADAELRARAEAGAKAESWRNLDEVPEGLELSANLDPALKRETVLHYEVKKILEEARKILVPRLEVTVEIASPNGETLSDTWSGEPHFLELTNIVLEHRLGRIIPDVVCDACAAGGAILSPFFIEVTVTNQIDGERLSRIQAMRAAALEIDLSLTGGRVTREQLRSLVVQELTIKRWLHHPELEYQRGKLEEQVSNELAALTARKRQAAVRRQGVLATPLSEVAFEYLDAVLTLQDVRAAEDEGEFKSSVVDASGIMARERVADAADKLAIHGFPEAADDNLIGWHGIIARILSIQLDRGVGYRLSSGFAVLNAIRQAKGPERSNHTLYFIALRVYKPNLTEDQTRWLDKWIAEVKISIKSGESTYLRDPAYDRLLSLIFPKMAEALSKSFGKRKSSEESKPAAIRRAFRSDLGYGHYETIPTRRRASFIESQPKALAADGPLRDTPSGDWWLKGRDLEEWKKENPEAAAAWFAASGLK